jgi:hypothetical protein
VVQVGGRYSQSITKISVLLNRNFGFVVHDTDTKAEVLGDMELGGDAAALSFGRLVIRELIHRAAGYCSGWTLDITEDKRAVGSVPLDAVPCPPIQGERVRLARGKTYTFSYT